MKKMDTQQVSIHKVNSQNDIQNNPQHQWINSARSLFDISIDLNDLPKRLIQLSKMMFVTVTDDCMFGEYPLSFAPEDGSAGFIVCVGGHVILMNRLIDSTTTDGKIEILQELEQLDISTAAVDYSNQQESKLLQQQDWEYINEKYPAHEILLPTARHTHVITIDDIKKQVLESLQEGHELNLTGCNPYTIATPTA